MSTATTSNDTSIISDPQTRLAFNIAAMPEPAQELYFDKEQKFAADLAYIQSLSDQINEAASERTAIRGNIARALQSQSRSTGATKHSLAQIDTLRRNEAAATAKLKRLQEQRKNYRGSATPIEPLKDWLISLNVRPTVAAIDDARRPGATIVTELAAPIFEDASVDVRPRKGQSDAEGLTEAVETLAKFREKRKADGKALPSLEECDRQIDADVAAEARKGKPNLEHVLQRRKRTAGGKAEQGHVRFPGQSFYGEDWEARAGVSFLCWLNPEAVAARMKLELRKQHNFADALPAAEREKRIRDLNAAIAQQERVVEAWALRCERSGTSYVRSWQSRPEAILGIKVVENAGEFE